MGIPGVLCLLAGIFLAFGTGANDAANSMGAAVGAGTRTNRQACALVAVFGVLGVVIGGAPVAGMAGRGIVDPTGLGSIDRTVLTASGLLASSLWVNATTRLGLPTSTSHSIVTALAGAGLAMHPGGVQWRNLVLLGSAWVMTPLIAGTASIILLRFVRGFKGRERAVGGHIGWMLTASGVWMAFSWGAAGLGNIAGPVALGTGVDTKVIMLAMGVSAALGVLSMGKRVISTVGEGITPLTPLTALACETASAVTVWASSNAGLPVSSSHAMVGAVTGAGKSQGRLTSPSQIGTIRTIVASWALTPVACVPAGYLACSLIRALS